MDSEQYIKKYTEGFAKSSQFSSLPSHLKDEAAGHTETFLEFLFNYEISKIEEVRPQNIRTVLTQIFPRKYSAEPEEFRRIIPVLVSFFEYLDQAKLLKETDALIKAVKDSEEAMIKNAANPEYYGMAKSFVVQMKQDGVDSEDEAAVARWISDYNQKEKDLSDDSKQKPFSKAGPKTGRNDPCSCGSGKKYKKCCG